MRVTTERLMDEHERIISFLNILFRAVRMERGGKLLGSEFWEGAISFIREFSDDYHHAKEEKLLFPAYCRRGMSDDHGPVAVMLRDHDHFRRCIGIIEESLSHGDDGNISRWQACGDFIESLRFHIHKENNILYPMGEDILTNEDEKELLIAFDAADDARGGAAREEEFSRLAASLEERLLAAYDKEIEAEVSE